jgi:hypothetical protein
MLPVVSFVPVLIVVSACIWETFKYYVTVVMCIFKTFQVPKYIANKWEKAPGNIEVGKLKISK